MQKAMFVQLVAGLLIGGGVGAALGYYGKCTSGTCPLTANPYRGAFLGSLMGGLLAFSVVPSRPAGNVGDPGDAGDASEEGSDHAAPEIDNAEDFTCLVLQADMPVLVDFYSNGCPPCRQLAPMIDQLAEEYKGRAVVYKVNVEDSPELASQNNVQGLPAVLFFTDGKETQRLVRLQSRKTYTDVLDSLIG
jgi:thioredoxin 1